MSYTEIYIIKKSGDVRMYREIQNSHRGAMFVWESLRKQYFPEESFFSYKKIWDAIQKGKYEDFEDITLATTFDWVMLPKAGIPAVQEAFEKFSKKYPGNSSLLEQSMTLEMIKGAKCIGVCWNQTSVNDMWSGTYDSKDNIRLFNIYKDEKDKTWWMFNRRQHDNG